MFIFGHPAVFEGWFHCHGRHVAIEPIDQLFCLSSLSSLFEVPSQAARVERGQGRLHVPGHGLQGRQASSMSLAGMPLNADFQVITATLLQLGSLETLSLRSAHGIDALPAAPRCGPGCNGLTCPGMPAYKAPSLTWRRSPPPTLA